MYYEITLKRKKYLKNNNMKNVIRSAKSNVISCVSQKAIEKFIKLVSFNQPINCMGAAEYFFFNFCLFYAPRLFRKYPFYNSQIRDMTD